MRDEKNPNYTGNIADDRDLMVSRGKARKLHKALEDFMLTVDTCAARGYKLDDGYIDRVTGEARSFMDSMAFVDRNLVEMI